MSCKRIILLSLLLLLPLVSAPVQAADSPEHLLLIYMTADGEVNERIVMAEANLSAFVDSIDVVAAENLLPGSTQSYQHVAFIGDTEGRVAEDVRQELRGFTGNFLVFGHNAEQFHQFQDWIFAGEQRITSVEGYLLDTVKSVIHAISPKDATVLAETKTIEQQIPYIAKAGNVSFIATTAFSTDEKYVLSRELYSIFDVHPPANHPAYIRLEGITPISKVQDVRETGGYLADRGIPFILSVTPVHLNPKTQETVLLSSNKKLVAELKSLQSRGGVVIVTGYNHSYRDGVNDYEFWDIERNQPIVSSSIDGLPPSVQTPTNFSSDEEYLKYRAEDFQEEADMIRVKHQLAIEMLVELGLYPAGVQIPQYTMSANGYSVTSENFSALFGRLQVSDTDGRMLNTPLFITNPEILAGMTLYPETIGYVNPDALEPFEEMAHSVKRLQTVPGAVIGGFYHTYLGAEYLPEMINRMESVPGLQWIDFPQANDSVQTPEITIRQTADGIQVTSTITVWQQWMKTIRKSPLDASLWAIAVVVILFLASFAAHVLSLRLRLKKRLFEEREHHD